MKKLLIIPTLIIILFILTGCGQIASEKELKKYAEKNYGKANLINYIKNDDYSEAEFEDEEYKFKYKVKSYFQDINIDGSSFGTQEQKKSNFTEEYLNIMNIMTKNKFKKIENEYNCSIEWSAVYIGGNYDENILISVNLNNSSLSKEILTEIGTTLKNLDNRNFFSNAIIYGEQNNECVGEYTFIDDTYRDNKEVEVNWALRTAFSIMKSNMKINIRDISELQYIKTETMDIKDIPGIQLNNVQHRITDAEEDFKHVNVYFFSYNKETWIIADVLIKDDNNYIHLYVSKFQ